METRLLKMFCVVAENGSLVTAAGKLHLTPSALSHGLKSLEGQLGCRLFERAGRRMVLNQAGEQFLMSIQPPLAALDPYMEAEEASFNTSIDSISSGLMSLIELISWPFPCSSPFVL